MKITIDNYEQYVLDYLEGNLNPEDENLFDGFLDRYPEIRAEIEGVDQYVLVPDMEIKYPDKSQLYRKKQGIILPFWNINRMVAAAAVLLLVSATTFFIWKSSQNGPSLLSVNPLPKTNTTKSGNEETVTRSPMQEILPGLKKDTQDVAVQEQAGSGEGPESGVVAPQEERSVQPNKVDHNVPESTSDVAIDHINHSVKQNAINSTDDSLKPVPMPNSSDRPDTEVAVMDVKSFHIDEDRDNAVAYLPLRNHEITMQPVLLASYTQVNSRKTDSQTFKIHIPGEFLSETWGDVSVAQFKKKLIPEFIKNQLNL